MADFVRRHVCAQTNLNTKYGVGKYNVRTAAVAPTALGGYRSLTVGVPRGR